MYVSFRHMKIVAISVLVVLVIWFLLSLLFPLSETQKIERLVGQVVKAVEAKSIRDLRFYLSEDFSARPGGDLESVISQLRRFFFQVKDLGVSVEYLKHQSDRLPDGATSARLLVVVKVTGTINEQKFQAFGSAGADAFVTNMVKIDGKWLIESVRYVDASDPVKALSELSQ